MTTHVKLSKPAVWLTLIFIFMLGIEMGFLLDFWEAEARFQSHRQSLEETATWEP